MIDEERLAKRAELKRRLAERNVRNKQLTALRSHLAAINGKTDDAANQHQKSCGPLQAELKQIDDLQLTEIMDGERNDPTHDQRRLEIVGEIGRLNEMLEATSQTNKRLAENIEIQIAELGSTISKTVSLENELARTADRALHDRNAVLKSRIRWADRRWKAAVAALQNCEANLKAARHHRPRAVHGYETLLEAHNREVTDAQSQASLVQAEQNELRQQMLDA
jgi:hypothetical protein